MLFSVFRFDATARFELALLSTRHLRFSPLSILAFRLFQLMLRFHCRFDCCRHSLRLMMSAFGHFRFRCCCFFFFFFRYFSPVDC